MRRLTVLTATCVGVMLVAAGCNHDGRYLRPATPDQNATISTTALETTVPTSDVFEPGTGFGGTTDSATSDTLAPITAEPTTTLVADEPTSTVAGAAPPSTATGLDNAGSPVAGAVSAIAPWRRGAPIDARYTCLGANVSPPLSWTSAPPGTVEIAITLADVQAPTFVHWAIAGIDPATTSIVEGADVTGVIRGVNGDGEPGYAGPCPPSGQTHTYLLTVHYLDAQIELGDGAAGADMVLAINAATIAQAVITGTAGTG